MSRKPFLPSFTRQYRRLAVVALCTLFFGNGLGVALIIGTEISSSWISIFALPMHGYVAHIGIKLIRRGLLQRRSEYQDVREHAAIDHIGMGSGLLMIAGLTLYILMNMVLLPAP